MEKLYIDLGKNSYPIYIGYHLLKNLESFIGQADKYMMITDENVNTLFKDEIKSLLNNKNRYCYVINPGESSKNLDTVEKILSFMMDQGLTRNSRIISLGGGVVGDIAGFCASIYMRGISFIQVPTTLLSQVDSSVGGKTGVNMKEAKNIIGSFYQPKAVVIDIRLLKTLHRKEIMSGIGEIIKYGIIYDDEFLEYIDNEFSNLIHIKKDTMQEVIQRCCKIKADIVSRDEKEEGVRKILNYGHTIGHALEAATNYKVYTHGEAVLIGMYYEALMAKKLKYIDEEYFTKIEKVIKKTEISLKVDTISMEVLLDKMEKDKKNKKGKISFILPCGKGSVEEVLLSKEEIIW